MTDMEQELEQKVAEVQAGAQQVIDGGVMNMERAGELAAQALRESFSEAAKRTIEIGKLAMDEAVRIDQVCKEEADRLMKHGEEKAQELIEHFKRNQVAAT